MIRQNIISLEYILDEIFDSIKIYNKIFILINQDHERSYVCVWHKIRKHCYSLHMSHRFMYAFSSCICSINQFLRYLLYFDVTIIKFYSGSKY